MSGTVWLPGAERVAGKHSGGGSMVGGSPRCVHHITADKLGPNGERPRFEAVRDYLARAGFEPTLMIDPFTGRTAQFLPANRSAYALENRSGGVETNRQGSVCLQVEWFFSPGTVYQGRRYDTLDQTPMLGLPAVMALCASWGIPPVWPAGPTPPIGTSGNRSTALWLQAGHFGHSQVPENSHTDPGPLTLRTTPPPGDDMPLTPQDGETLAPFIAREVQAQLAQVMAGQLGQMIDGARDQILDATKTQTAALTALTNAVRASSGGVDPAKVAEQLTVVAK